MEFLDGKNVWPLFLKTSLWAFFGVMGVLCEYAECVRNLLCISTLYSIFFPIHFYHTNKRFVYFHIIKSIAASWRKCGNRFRHLNSSSHENVLTTTTTTLHSIQLKQRINFIANEPFHHRNMCVLCNASHVNHLNLKIQRMNFWLCKNEF